MSEKRKQDHIDKTKNAQTNRSTRRQGFHYEPLFGEFNFTPYHETFLGRTIKAPFWISSMTGGVDAAKVINQNLSKACGEFGLGMGLGSCRPLLDSHDRLSEFALRKNLKDSPFMANLGIAQLEQLILQNKLSKVIELVKLLEADGLIVHINPLQEWAQPEGDRYQQPASETLLRVKEAWPVDFKLAVKEVGQGMGPKSLQFLFELEVDAIEFGAYGGTNFTKLERLRADKDSLQNSVPTSVKDEFVFIGHTAEEMMRTCCALARNASFIPEFVISGGVDLLSGLKLLKSSPQKAVIGQASRFVEHAHDYDRLCEYIVDLIEAFNMGEKFLKVKNEDH